MQQSGKNCKYHHSRESCRANISNKQPDYSASCSDQAHDERSGPFEVKTDAEIVTTEIYTIDGRRVEQMEDGVNIIRTIDANGNVTTTKVLK